MLAEVIAHIRSGDSKVTKRLGYTKEHIAIGARYQRQKDSWDAHHKHCHQAIEEAIKHCPQTRTCLIIGSGRCLDIPLEKLSNIFNDIILVDIVRQKAITDFNNIKQITSDITELTSKVYNHRNIVEVPVPSLFLDQDDIDLVISDNVLSQLAWPMAIFLEKHGINEDAIYQFCQEVIKAHLTYINNFHCTTCLITDHTKHSFNPRFEHTQSANTLYNISLPFAPVTLKWQWYIEPKGESGRDAYAINDISCLINPA